MSSSVLSVLCVCPLLCSCLLSVSLFCSCWLSTSGRLPSLCLMSACSLLDTLPCSRPVFFSLSVLSFLITCSLPSVFLSSFVLSILTTCSFPSVSSVLLSVFFVCLLVVVWLLLGTWGCFLLLWLFVLCVGTPVGRRTRGISPESYNRDITKGHSNEEELIPGFTEEAGDKGFCYTLRVGAFQD